MVQLVSAIFLEEVGSRMKVTLYIMLHNVLLLRVDLIAWLMGGEIEVIQNGDGSQRIVTSQDLMCMKFLKSCVANGLFLLVIH